MRDFFELLVQFLILAACGLALFLSIGSYVDSYKCSSYAEMTGKRTEYKWFDSCYVETKDGWQRWDEYKVRSAAIAEVERMLKL